MVFGGMVFGMRNMIIAMFIEITLGIFWYDI
jgi:hypothetical protein